jgi:hypothetical protein
MKRVNSIWSISDEVLQKTVDLSISLSEVLRILGFNERTGARRTLKKRITESNIDISHFRHRLAGKPSFIQRPISDYLIIGSSIQTHVLKKRLIKEGIFENKCCLCGLGDKWCNKLLILQLDHINGVNNDNRLENLRILCPNCHTQTETHSGKHLKIIHYCKSCNCKISRWSKKGFCNQCACKNQKYKLEVEKDILQRLVWEMPIINIAKMFFVSDQTVLKRCKKLNITKPPRGYWLKSNKNNGAMV